MHERDEKTEECITYDANWDPVVIPDKCCETVVAQPTQEPTPEPPVNRCPANVMDDNENGNGPDECIDMDEFEVFCHGKCSDCCYEKVPPCPEGAQTIEDKEGKSCILKDGTSACTQAGACGVCCTL